MDKQRQTNRQKAGDKEELRRRRTSKQDTRVNDAGADLLDSGFTPRVNDHSTILSRVQSDDRRADLTLQLQRSYGNSYVRRILNSVSTSPTPTIQRGSPVSSPGAAAVEIPEEPNATQSETTQEVAPGTAPPAPGVAEPNATQSGAVEQVETNTIPPAPPAPAPAEPNATQSGAEQEVTPGTAPPAPGVAGPNATQSGAEQEVTPGTAPPAPGVAGPAATQIGGATAAPASPASAAIRDVWNNDVLGPLQGAHAVLTGSGSTRDRARQALESVRRAKDTVNTIRPNYGSNIEIFGRLVYAQSTLETVITAIAPHAGEGVSLEEAADYINPDVEDSRLNNFRTLGGML